MEFNKGSGNRKSGNGRIKDKPGLISVQKNLICHACHKRDVLDRAIQRAIAILLDDSCRSIATSLAAGLLLVATLPWFALKRSWRKWEEMRVTRQRTP